MNDEMIDFFADSQEVVASDDTLQRIRVLAERLVHKQEELVALEEAMVRTKKEIVDIEQYELPRVMDEAGVPLIGLDNGKKVSVEEVVHASIPKAKQTQAFAWLRANGEGSLIKNKVSASFDKGKDVQAARLIEQASQLGITMTQESSVHWSTFTAWAKEQLSAGRDLPLETLGIFVGRKAKVAG